MIARRWSRFVLSVVAGVYCCGTALAGEIGSSYTPKPGGRPALSLKLAQYQGGPSCGQSRCDGGMHCCSNYMRGGWAFWCCPTNRTCGEWRDCR